MMFDNINLYLATCKLRLVESNFVGGICMGSKEQREGVLIIIHEGWGLIGRSTLLVRSTQMFLLIRGVNLISEVK